MTHLHERVTDGVMLLELPLRSPARVPTRHFAEFLLTVYVLILIPGPSVLFVISRGVA